MEQCPTPAQFRKLHAALRDLGISREDFKRRTCCFSMLEWDRRTVASRIKFLKHVSGLPYPERRKYGATR